MQNTGFNQEKHKRSLIWPWKITERIESCKILEVTDDEGAINWLIGIKYTVIVADNGSPILTMPQSTSHILCETRVLIQDRGGHTPWSITRQDRLRYINLLYTSILVVLISSQNMCKIFPHISWLENIALIKGWYWYFAITIEAILFVLDRWWWSITHKINPLENIWQR